MTTVSMAFVESQPDRDTERSDLGIIHSLVSSVSLFLFLCIIKNYLNLKISLYDFK